MQKELEELRKHEDNLIFTEGNFFLVAQTLLVTAISIVAAISVKILIVITAIILSIFWILIGIRHRALMNWYSEEIINQINPINAPDPTLSQIHRKLRNWKKQNNSYRCTGHNIGLRATNIRCIWIPLLFLGFWILMALFQLIQLIILLRSICLQAL